MSARTIANDLHRGGGAQMSLKQILGIIQALQKKAPVTEDDFLVRYLAYSPLVDIHTGTVAEQPGADLEDDAEDVHFNSRLPVRRIHIPRARNFGTLANSGMTYAEYDEAPGRIFGGGATSLDFSTSDDVPISDIFTLGVWLYLPEPTHADPIIELGNIELTHSTTGWIRSYYNGGSSHVRAVPITRQAWQYLAMIQDGASIRMFVSDGTGTPDVRSTTSAPDSEGNGMESPETQDIRRLLYGACVTLRRPAGHRPIGPERLGSRRRQGPGGLHCRHARRDNDIPVCRLPQAGACRESRAVLRTQPIIFISLFFQTTSMGLTLHLEKTTKVIMDLKDSLNLSTSVMYEHHGVEPGDRTIKLTKAEMAELESIRIPLRKAIKYAAAMRQESLLRLPDVLDKSPAERRGISDAADYANLVKNSYNAEFYAWSAIKHSINYLPDLSALTDREKQNEITIPPPA